MRKQGGYWGCYHPSLAPNAVTPALGVSRSELGLINFGRRWRQLWDCPRVCASRQTTLICERIEFAQARQVNLRI